MCPWQTTTFLKPIMIHFWPRPGLSSHVQLPLDGPVCPPICAQCAPETEIEALELQLEQPGQKSINLDNEND